MLIVKKLGQLCDQKDERIKELSRDLNNINYWLQAAIKKTQLNNIVKKKNVGGTQRIYPVCNKAILFSCIAASKTLCPRTVANIKKLGYKFETQKEEI